MIGKLIDYLHKNRLKYTKLYLVHVFQRLNTLKTDKTHVFNRF